MIELWTDGSCTGDHGGWAFVAVSDGEVVHRDSGAVSPATSEGMEKQAIAEAIGWAEARGEPFRVYCDSTAAVNSARRSEVVWVKGHDGEHFNELADALAGEAARTLLAEHGFAVVFPHPVLQQLDRMQERLEQMRAVGSEHG